MPSRKDETLRQALRDRLETDWRLGARALPVAPLGPARPARGGPGQVHPPPAPRATVPPEEAERRSAALRLIDNEEVKPCTKCALCETRTNTVFGVGSPAARIMFIGEAPGADEDATGEPFVGRAGGLLNKMIAAMGLRREDTYIGNVLKCRPPDNRTPATDEIASCRDYLFRQIEIIQPEVIIALGAPAAQTLLGTTEGIGRLRGRWHDFYISGSALVGTPIPLMPTYHPAYLLRAEWEKAKAWADLQMVMARLGMPVPQSKK